MVATQVQTVSSTEALRGLPNELDRDALIRAFRTMYLARSLDDREILLKRQNRIFFQISGAGHEAVGTATGMLLKPGRDWVFPYYRDRALALTLGELEAQRSMQLFAAHVMPHFAAAPGIRRVG